MKKKESNPMKWFLFGSIALLVLLLLWLVASYNGLVTSKAGVDEAWANVETQYQRRADLIPNLVEVAKGSASFQQETFTDIARLRSQWQASMQSGDRAEQIQVGEQMGSALARLLVVVENYPDLNVEAFTNLQAQVEGTENRVAVSRTRYNEVVKAFNIKVRRVPTNIVAGMFGFGPEPFYEAQEGAETAPVISFS